MEKHQEVMENSEPHSTVEQPDVQDYQEPTENDALTDPVQMQPNSKALFLLKMKEDRRISQSNVDGLVADFTVLLQEEILSLKKDVISCIQHGHDLNDSIRKVDELFSQVFCVPLSRCLDSISSKEILH